MDTGHHLKSQCPNQAFPRDIKSWCHNKCGGKILVNYELDIWCIHHPRTVSFIQDWRFGCEKCGHNDCDDWKGQD